MIQFDIPLPPRELSPNARVHWKVKAKAAKDYRGISWLRAREAAKIQCLAWEKAEIEYEFFCGPTFGDPRYRPRDDDNARASMKNAQDGFADAGIFVADAAKHVKVTTVHLYRTKKEHQGKALVRVTIHETGEQLGEKT